MTLLPFLQLFVISVHPGAYKHLKIGMPQPGLSSFISLGPTSSLLLLYASLNAVDLVLKSSSTSVPLAFMTQLQALWMLRPQASRGRHSFPARGWLSSTLFPLGLHMRTPPSGQQKLPEPPQLVQLPQPLEMVALLTLRSRSVMTSSFLLQLQGVAPHSHSPFQEQSTVTPAVLQTRHLPSAFIFCREPSSPPL